MADVMTNSLNRENVEMPIKVGLDFLRHADGSLVMGNRANVEKRAARMARDETRKTRFLWQPSIWQGLTYFRISLGGQYQTFRY